MILRLNNYWERCPEWERVFPVLWSYTTFVCTNEGRSLSDRHKDLAETGASECGSVRADVMSHLETRREGGKGANEDRLYVHLDWCRHDKPRARLRPHDGVEHETCKSTAHSESGATRNESTREERRIRHSILKRVRPKAHAKPERWLRPKRSVFVPRKAGRRWLPTRTLAIETKDPRCWSRKNGRAWRSDSRSGAHVYTFSDASGWSCQLLYACLRD